jgi:hypothetical protein
LLADFAYVRHQRRFLRPTILRSFAMCRFAAALPLTMRAARPRAARRFEVLRRVTLARFVPRVAGRERRELERLGERCAAVLRLISGP